MSKQAYRWATPGDVNAFFGLMLDNVAGLLLMVGLLSLAFDFPTRIAIRYMAPGTAIGVLVGDLLFFWMAFRLARRTGRDNITAMPLGLDTPSTIGMVLFVLGPAFIAAKEAGLSEEAAAMHTWRIGICAIFISGLFKFACAFGANTVRRIVPRAGLLGSLAAIALVLISFLPLMEVFHSPVVGLTALAIVLTTLVARVETPLRIPGALAALLTAGGLYYLMMGAERLLGWEGLLPHTEPAGLDPSEALLPYEWLAVFRFEWLAALPDSLQYLPIVIPFALATVVGGIDCTESAAAAGDEFDTGAVIGVEALATLVAGLCGGVIQTTPYIGHPAYKAMGGRAAYTLATALFIGGAGLIGYFGFLYIIIPKATVFPILVFIGLEITAQSFSATPVRHYPAVVLACIPALATLVMIYADNLLGAAAAAGVTQADLPENLQSELGTIRTLANGFIVTSLVWASALAALIDRRLYRASLYFALAGAFSLFGVMHSPFPGGPMFLPWRLEGPAAETPLRYFAGYMLVVLILVAWGWWLSRRTDSETSRAAEHLESE